MDTFKEKLNGIKQQIGLINVWPGDRIDKDSKLNAVKIIEQLEGESDLEKRKELISDLRTTVGLIDVWKGDNIDKDAKTKAQELIEALG